MQACPGSVRYIRQDLRKSGKSASERHRLYPHLLEIRMAVTWQKKRACRIISMRQAPYIVSQVCHQIILLFCAKMTRIAQAARNMSR